MQSYIEAGYVSASQSKIEKNGRFDYMQYIVREKPVLNTDLDDDNINKTVLSNYSKAIVIREKHDKDFTVFHNHVFLNQNLSVKAKGLLCQMLSLPDNWKFSLRCLITLSSDGLASVSSAVKELREAGYVTFVEKDRVNGKIAGIEYIIREKPVSPVEIKISNKSNMINSKKITDENSQPDSVFVHSDMIHADKSPQYNTKKSNTKKSNTKSIVKKQNVIVENSKVTVEKMTERIKLQINYNMLLDKSDVSTVNVLIEIMLEYMLSKSSYVRIGKTLYPKELVEKRLLQIDYDSMIIILDNIANNPNPPRSLKAYLSTCLINAHLKKSFTSVKNTQQIKTTSYDHDDKWIESMQLDALYNTPKLDNSNNSLYTVNDSNKDLAFA